ncbi:MAG: asparagine synthase C-terminal domain-containing protein [Candidatus Uhrbacteria bacterium]
MNGWREAVSLPVIAGPNQAWSTDDPKDLLDMRKHLDLEARLLAAHRECGSACLESNGGVIAMTLSGGLDSTLSLAMLRTLTPDARIRTFTIGGSQRHPDLRFARIAATHFRVAVTALHVPSDSERALARSEIQAMGDPSPTDGGIGVMALYRFMADRGLKMVIAGDGIDELTGGYWKHRAGHSSEETRAAFEHFWSRLAPDHLEPLERKAERVGISIVFPYLQRSVVEYVARIPLAERTSREESKKPLRTIARRYGVPKEIIARPKRGFCDALCNE